MNIIIWDYGSVWPKVWPQNKYRSLWPIFHGPVILRYILKTIWYMNIVFWDNGSVWSDVWPQSKCRSLWFCLVSWRLFDVWTSLFGIMIQYDPTVDIKIKVGHCDLYFMVQWFCVISWRLFDVWTSYFGIMGHYDQPFDLKINVGHCDLYFMDQWFCLMPQRLFGWVSYFQIMRQGDPLWPQSKYKSTWPIVHGLVILSYISKVKR